MLQRFNASGAARQWPAGASPGSGFLYGSLDHSEEHFEALFGSDRMGHIRRHHQHLAAFGDEHIFLDLDHSLSVEDMDHGVSRGGMCTSPFACLECKQGNPEGLVPGQRAADDAAFFVFNQVGQYVRFGNLMFLII